MPETPAGSRSDAELSPPRSRRKGCGCWTILLVCLLTPPSFAAAGYGLWRWTAAAQVANLIAAAEERGEPTTIEELEALYPSTPENERATELWRLAADAATPKDPNIAGELGRLYTELDNGVPSHEMRSQGARATFDEEGLLVDVYRPVAERFRGEIAAAVESAEDAEQAGGTTRFLIVGERILGSIEHWNRFLALFAPLRLEIELRRVQGDADGVARGIATMLALGEALKNEPDPNAQAVRWWSVVESVQPLKASLIRDDLSDESLENLQSRYEAVSFDAAIRPALLAHQLIEIRRSHNQERMHEGYGRTRYCPEEVTALTLGSLREMIDAAESPDAAVAAHDGIRDRMRELVWGPGTNDMTRWMTGMRYAEPADRLDDIRTSAYGMRNGELYARFAATAIACVRYRHAEGELPETLDALVPKYLSEVPRDVLAEPAAPVKYLATEAGFVVYSVGRDQKDDGATRPDGRELDDVLRIEKAEFAPPPLLDEEYLSLDGDEGAVEETPSDEPPGEEEASESSEESGAPAEQP
ncbi:MAG TPA: hypothetical protein VGN57_07385 [Pirellulaceae bacterium]|jgi:hypothetical protein|nr:hypothetical protein [Pirellulaceae bacterium]